MGFRAPLKIEQDALRNDPQVRIAFTLTYTPSGCLRYRPSRG